MPRTRRTNPKATPPAPADTPQALLRREHAGKWLAWSEDESAVVATGDSPEAVRAAAERAGHARFIYDWVPPADERQVTGPV